MVFFFFSSRRRHTRSLRDWSSDVCSSDLPPAIGEVNFHQWLGDGWGVLFSHPADFTPVCTTELGTVAKIKGEFAKRDAKVLAISVDPLESHHGWIQDINETQAC